MKELINKSWNNFKKQPDVWLFFVFLIAATLNIRKVLFFFPIQETFNEYTGLYLYISDIFFILVLIALLFSILRNNNNVLSRYKLWTSTVIHSLYLFIPGLLVLISFISIIWSHNQLIALYRSLKLFEAYLIYLYIATRFIPIVMFHVEHYDKLKSNNNYKPNKTIVKQNSNLKTSSLATEPVSILSEDMLAPRTPAGEAGGTINPTRNCSTWNNFLLSIILLGVIQSVTAIWQFIIQHSIGFFWLGESLISPNMPGVAKIIFHGQKYIRAYGLFPHPNILGGFLLFSIVITLLYKNTIVPRLPAGEAGGTITSYGKKYINYFYLQKFKIKKIWLVYSILWLQGIALLLTFSKSAIIGLLIALVYIKLFHACLPARQVEQFEKMNNRSVVSLDIPYNCSTWNNCICKKLSQTKTFISKQLFHVEHSKKIILSGLILLLIFFLLKPSLNTLFLQSLEERSFYLNVSRGTILTNPLLGIGSGQFALSISQYNQKNVELWQFQPVHNIYLLMWSELGIVFLGFFLWLLWKLLRNCSTWNNLKIPLLSTKYTLAVSRAFKLLCLPARQVEQFEKERLDDRNVPRGTFQTGASYNNTTRAGDSTQSISILCNNNNVMSIETTLGYFQGILLGFLFIGIFDHYLWDIWSGQILFWLTLGIIAGIKRKC